MTKERIPFTVIVRRECGEKEAQRKIGTYWIEPKLLANFQGVIDMCRALDLDGEQFIIYAKPGKPSYYMLKPFYVTISRQVI